MPEQALDGIPVDSGLVYIVKINLLSTIILVFKAHRTKNVVLLHYFYTIVISPRTCIIQNDPLHTETCKIDTVLYERR